jgi:hypothetical protein
MRRRNLVAAFALSFLLHALLATVLWWSVRPRRRPELTAVHRPPLEIQIIQLPAEKPKLVTEKQTAKQESATRLPKRRPIPAPTLDAPPPLQPQAERPTGHDAPIQRAEEGGTPRALSLLPRDRVEELDSPSGEDQRGRTISPDDPSLSGWVKRAEEELRVKQRVDGFAGDAAAEARAQRGLPHPYLTQVREALRGGLNAADGGTPAALGAHQAVEFLFNQYRSAAEQYGKTGGDPGVIQPGLAPRQTEKQKELFGNEPQSEWTRAITQSADTIQNLAYGAPLLAVTLELRQDPSGRMLSERIVEKSASAKFDAFVLRVVPAALAGLGAVPEDARRGGAELRSVWRIQGWARLPKNLERTMTMFGAPAVQGIPMDVIAKQRAAHEQFDFRARLLRAY